MKHLLLTHTVKYYIQQEGFFPQRFTMRFLENGEKKSLLKPGELLRG